MLFFFFPTKYIRYLYFIWQTNMEIIWWLISIKEILLDHRSSFQDLYTWLIRDTVTHWYRSFKHNSFTTVNFSKYFLPYEWVKTSRRTYLIKNLKSRCDQNLEGTICLQEKKFLNHFFSFHNKHWEISNRYCSFSKYRFGFAQIIGYIWRYVKRPIIAQSRLIDYDGSNGTYSFRDKYDNNKTKTITINAIDFIWSIVQHIPEKYFHMVYYYGIFSTRSKQKYLPIINQLHPTTRIYNRIPKNYASRMFLF